MQNVKTKSPAGGSPGQSKENLETQNHCKTTPAEKLLHRLDRVRELGPGRWVACCPAHDDKHPSFTVREVDDGTLLIKCWAGCTADEVVAAVGLDLADLFPPRGEGRGPLRKGERWIPRDVLIAVASEATVVAIAADDIVAGRPISEADRARIRTASVRLHGAVKEVA